MIKYDQDNYDSGSGLNGKGKIQCHYGRDTKVQDNPGKKGVSFQFSKHIWLIEEEVQEFLTSTVQIISGLILKVSHWNMDWISLVLKFLEDLLVIFSLDGKEGTMIRTFIRSL